MKNSRFIVLTGHLNDHSLSDLVGILRHQRKTGRLLIEYAKGPAGLYFQEGALVDAELNNLRGLQAICVALAQPPAPFNFNPLIQPSRRSIENSLQRVVSELLGCWDEHALEIDALATDRALLDTAPFALPGPTTTDSVQGKRRHTLALPAMVQQSPVINHSRTILVVAVAGLMILGLSTVIAVTSGLVKRASSAPSLPSTAESAVRSERGSGAERSSSPKTAIRSASGVQREVPRGGEGSLVFGQSRRREGRGSSIKKDETENSEASRVPSSAVAPAIIREDDRKSPEGNASSQSVKVIMQIENGRVLQASVANHKSGMEAYEALALRIARQRRYPPKAAGQESVTIKVSQPN